MFRGPMTTALAVGQAAMGSACAPSRSRCTALPATVSRSAVVNRIFLGEHTEYLVASAALGEFLVLVPRQAEATEGRFEPGDDAHAHWRDGTALILGED